MEHIVEVRDDLVRSELHYLLPRSGEELVSANLLRFRTEAELTGSLTDAGFSVQHVFGDWHRQPVGADTPELIYVATRKLTPAEEVRNACAESDGKAP